VVAFIATGVTAEINLVLNVNVRNVFNNSQYSKFNLSMKTEKDFAKGAQE